MKTGALSLGSYPSPIGKLWILYHDNLIVTVSSKRPTQFSHNPAHLRLPQRIASNLNGYFKRGQRLGSKTICLAGTKFQKLVWRAAARVPFGKTATYREIAHRIGRPNAVRAVGSALGANKILLYVPCHRIVSTHGLGGFACGLAKKKWLLRHEGSLPVNP